MTRRYKILLSYFLYCSFHGCLVSKHECADIEVGICIAGSGLRGCEVARPAKPQYISREHLRIN